MPLQTNYGLNQAPGYAGLVANQETKNPITRTASAAIAFGAPVQRNGAKGCSPLVSGGEFLGIAIAQHLVTGNGDSYVQYDNVPLIDEGVVWGVADAAIAIGAVLNWNTATGRYTTATPSGTVIAVPGAEADEAPAAAAALFKIRLRRVPS